MLVAVGLWLIAFMFLKWAEHAADPDNFAGVLCGFPECGSRNELRHKISLPNLLGNSYEILQQPCHGNPFGITVWLA